MDMHRLPIVLATAACVLFISADRAGAQASDRSQRERELEELVRQLTRRVEELERRLNELEEGKADQATETRVRELEETVQRIREKRLPAAQPEGRAGIKKWINDPNALRPYWKDGLRLDSDDGSIKLKIGGRIHNDWAFFVGDKEAGKAKDDDFEDDVEFRRARLYFSGAIYDNVEFKAEYDFAGGDADFKDVYVGLNNVPYAGGIRIGHFKEPFSLEELASSNNITFMERSLVNAFVPSRNVGVMVHNDLLDERMTWAAGIFRRTDDLGSGTGSGDFNVTARLTVLPWYEDLGKKLLHFGLAYTHQSYEDDVVRFRSRPESHLAPYVVDTGEFPAEHGDLIGAEAAWVHGPLSLQGEYVRAFMQGKGRRINDPDFWAASVQMSCFLTGEHRPYERSKGAFSRIKPLRNFGKDDGPGAWEIAARYSHLNLNGEGVDGGRLRDLTIGLNWYLNPNLRMMWNYVLADPTGGGDVSIFQWRFQIAF